jgi:hypothetical protein
MAASGTGFPIDGRGPDNAMAFPNLFQLFGNASDAKVKEIENGIKGWAASQAANAHSAAALETIFRAQADIILEDKGTPNIFSEKRE